MKVILAAIAAAVVLAVIAALVLPMTQQPAWQAYSTPSARVGDPGHNLVPEWTSGKKNG